MNRFLSLTLTALLFSSPIYADSNDHGHMSKHENGDHESHTEEGRMGSEAGHPGRVSDISHTIHLSINDSMKFSEDNLNIKVGDTIRFIISNDSQLEHEFMIGDKEEMREHAAMMGNMPNMKHDQGNVISLAPGETDLLIWTFTQAGPFEAACHLPGHYEAGMKAALDVTYATAKSAL